LGSPTQASKKEEPDDLELKASDDTRSTVGLDAADSARFG
jgi:hypothetical protein